MSPNLEAYIPGLRELRAAERLNRALAFAGITKRVCGVEVLPLTPNTRLELQLVKNACAFGVKPLAGDVFQFLWALSPARGTLRALWVRRRLKRHVLALDLDAAGREIVAHVAEQLQDMPEAAIGPAGGEMGDYVHWMAAEAGFWIEVHGGFTLETYRRTPYLVLQQLHRAWRCNHPKIIYHKDGAMEAEAPNFINASDRLIGDWQKARADEIKTIILSRRERLPN